MSRRTSMRSDGRRANRERWICLGGHDKFKSWQLAGTRYLVLHCGHPTALYPWYGVRPNGSMILSGPRAFPYVNDAKVAVEIEHATAAERRRDRRQGRRRRAKGER